MSPALLLLITLLLPLGGSAVIALFARSGVSQARSIALVVSLLTLVTAGWLVAEFPGGNSLFAESSTNWLEESSGIDVRLAIGLDGLSVWLFGLSALLVLTCVLVSWEAIQEGAAGFYALLLLLETGMLGVFAARDIILFYIFFEFTLIPLFFLIGVWGSEQRQYAAVKFFIFTLTGSVLTLVGLLCLVIYNYQHPGDGPPQMTFSIAELTAGLNSGEPVPTTLQVWLFLALFAGFAIKVPLFPLHTWLPLAHVQAPTAGSVLLAGVLLKVGTYGFLRFNVPMLPAATAVVMPYLLWLSVIGILYGALVALAQTDIKRLIAYSSVSHLGFCMLGIFALNQLGTEGGALQMINHGLSTGGLFACIGMLYERYHTREIRELGGVARRLPILAFFLLVFTFSSIGLPGLNGFAGEFLLLIGMFQRAFAMEGVWATQMQWVAVLAVLGVVLGAWYMLWLVERTFFGPLKEPSSHSPPRDLAPREVAALLPLVVFIVWIGIRPETFLAPMRPALQATTQAATAAFEASQAQTATRLAADQRRSATALRLARNDQSLPSARPVRPGSDQGVRQP